MQSSACLKRADDIYTIFFKKQKYQFILIQGNLAKNIECKISSWVILIALFFPPNPEPRVLNL